jgi:quinol-cytochrome oxidoreductase complex cytochrome b subunit
VKVSARAVRWTHTFGLGGTSFVLWCALAASGILMLLVYQPAPGAAHASIQTLEHSVAFGSLIRGIHYWGANLLVAIVLLHVTRVVLTGGYHRPRRVNWVVGAGLLVGVLASAFTGYLLPWDQRAYWAVTISTGMLDYLPGVGGGLQAVVRGGSEVGAETLLNFYTFHTTVLPVVAVGLMAFHFWRVRKAGGVVEPPPEADGAQAEEGSEKVLFFPHLLVRELAQALAVLAVVFLLAALAGAPIGERANPGMSPNPAKAPWYFMGFQELLLHLHPVFAVLLLPLAAVGGFVALPLLGDDAGPAGRWFLSPRGGRAAGLAAGAAVVLTVAAVLLDGHSGASATGGQAWLLRGLLPTVLLAGATAGIVGFSRRRFELGRNESLQTAVVFLFLVFVVLTVVGVWLRGENMDLVVPWGG